MIVLLKLIIKLSFNFLITFVNTHKKKEKLGNKEWKERKKKRSSERERKRRGGDRLANESRPTCECIGNIFVIQIVFKMYVYIT